jgi:anti-sigma factor ChrR (cupin superfamily)
LSELQALDRDLAPYQQQTPQSRQWSSPAERTRCQQQAARCEAVLREILLIEKQAEEQMTQQRDAVAQRLATFNQSAQAARAYIPAAAMPQTGMLDLSSEG